MVISGSSSTLKVTNKPFPETFLNSSTLKDPNAISANFKLMNASWRQFSSFEI